MLLIQSEFRLDHINKEAAKEQVRYEKLRLDVAQLSAPERIVATAQQRLGMVVPPQVAYLMAPGAPDSGTGANSRRSRRAEPGRRLGGGEASPWHPAVATDPALPGVRTTANTGLPKPNRRMAARRAKTEAGRAATAGRLTGRRAMALLIVLSLGLSAIILRLTQVQAVSAAEYEKLGAGQRIRKISLAAERGAIFDRNGVDLALSVNQQTVWANPKVVPDPVGYAAKLAPLLGMDQKTPGRPARAEEPRLRLPGPQGRRRHRRGGGEARTSKASTSCRSRSASTPRARWPRRCSATSASTTTAWPGSRCSTTRSWPASPASWSSSRTRRAGASPRATAASSRPCGAPT